MKKNIVFSKEARDKVKIGANILADAVSVTLGSSGKNVLISNAIESNYGLHQLPIRITKDGISVAEQVKVDDVVENVGVLLLREASKKSADQSGDGTTSTIVLARAILNEGLEAINAGFNSMELKRGIDDAVGQVIEELKRTSIPVGDDIEKIRNVATVSANNDSSIGDLIAEAFAKIGKDGVISVEESTGVKTEVKISDGFEFDRGYISPYFINDQGKGLCEFNDPYILLYEKTISSWSAIEGVVLAVMKENRPLVIICEDVDGEALAALSINNAQKKIQVCAVKSPFFGDVRREAMEDLAALTSATYISEIKGIALKNVSVKQLGTCRKIKISKDTTVVIGGDKDLEAQTELLNTLKMNLVDAKEDREKTIIQNRIARLEGGIAILSIGGPTEVEMKERLDRADDAVRATKSSCEEGVNAGGGTAFIRCEIAINARASKDFQAGQEIVQRALKAPLTQICLNAGVDPKEVINDVTISDGTIGYNAQTGKIEDLMESGIIDATKVLRCAITNAASVAGLILTSECMIVEGY